MWNSIKKKQIKLAEIEIYIYKIVNILTYAKSDQIVFYFW